MSDGEDDDFDLFRKTMDAHGIRKSKYQANKRQSDSPKRIPPRIKQSRLPRQLSISEDQIATSVTPSSAAIDQTDDEHSVLFVRKGVYKKTVKSLRQGTLQIEESLDLHGMRSHAATRALERFLAECLHYQMQCIQVIHGKGYGSELKGGVLKPLTIHWLKKQPDVLAFCAAIPRQGGSGATNILLRQH